MTRTLVIEPEAETEIDQAAGWYGQRSQAARIGFLRALDRTIDFIVEYPEQYQIIYRETRRALLEGYPYALFYNITATQVIVLACIHTARNPDRWP
jgi:plasmid stabilization system protein ParE